MISHIKVFGFPKGEEDSRTHPSGVPVAEVHTPCGQVDPAADVHFELVADAFRKNSLVRLDTLQSSSDSGLNPKPKPGTENPQNSKTTLDRCSAHLSPPLHQALTVTAHCNPYRNP